MELNMWLAKKRIKKIAFAKTLGISRMYLSKICNRYRPSKALAMKIEEVTEGEVSRYEIRPDMKKRKTLLSKVKQMDAFEDL